jgi:hypothetical protein
MYLFYAAVLAVFLVTGDKALEILAVPIAGTYNFLKKKLDPVSLASELFVSSVSVIGGGAVSTIFGALYFVFSGVAAGFPILGVWCVVELNYASCGIRTKFNSAGVLMKLKWFRVLLADTEDE